jgi:ribA/ribD-fused uncharacterized protein
MLIPPPSEPYPKTDRGFSGQYEFLSNFYPSPITYEGILYPTVEHAYQASKSHTLHIKKKIAGLSTPGKAKRYGQKITPLPQNWENLKVIIMSNLLSLKFNDPVLEKQLIDTGEDLCLEEVNFWGDTYWGTCNGNGSNRLGNLLMNIRWIKSHPPVTVLNTEKISSGMMDF